MEINALKVFLAVVDSGSFSKASEHLGYTPAGISYIINNLEEELGIKLIDRDYNGVKPNSNGMALLQDIRRVIDSYDSFENSVNARKTSRYATLHIATIETMSIAYLSQAIIAFQKKCPDVNVEISTGDPFEINSWIEEGISDIGLTERTWSSTKTHWFGLAHDPFLAVLPPDTDAPNPCPISFFKERDFFIPDYRRDRNVPVLLTQNGVKTNTLYDNACTQTVICNISAGRGSSIISALSYALYSDPISELQPLVLPLTPYAYREIGVTVKAELTKNKIVQTFLRCLQDTVKATCQQSKAKNALQQDRCFSVKFLEETSFI